MRGRAADRFGRFVSWLNYRYYAWRNGAGDSPVGDERLERELQNNILGLMPQAILSAKQGSVNPQSTAGARSET